MQAEISNGAVYVASPASGGKFWATPSGYGDSAVSIPGGAAAKDTAGTKYGSGSSVFTQTSTSATA